jgi:hypothetical protein
MWYVSLNCFTLAPVWTLCRIGAYTVKSYLRVVSCSREDSLNAPGAAAMIASIGRSGGGVPNSRRSFRPDVVDASA